MVQGVRSSSSVDQLWFKHQFFHERPLRSSALRSSPQMDVHLSDSLPLAIGPLSIVSVALQRHSTVCLTAAKVAERFGIPYVHSLRSSLSMETLDSSCSPLTERWIELFPFEDEGILRSLVFRAARYRFGTILLTIGETTSSPPSIIDEKSQDEQYIQSPDLEAVAPGTFPRSVHWKLLLEDPRRLVRVMEIIRSLTNLPIVLKIPIEQHTPLCNILPADAVCLTIDEYTLFSDYVGAIEKLQRHPFYSHNVYACGSCFTEQEVTQLISHGVQRVLIDQPIVWGLMIDGFEGISNVINIYKRNILKANR